jgi:hypothetical protein
LPGEYDYYFFGALLPFGTEVLFCLLLCDGLVALAGVEAPFAETVFDGLPETPVCCEGGAALGVTIGLC